MATKFSYYDNSVTCGNCNGDGCRQCVDLNIDLSGYGRTRFPLSQMINGCKPPYIQQPYAGKLSPRVADHIITEYRIRNHR